MIETLPVIHCDVLITLIGRDRERHPGRCEMFFPARGGYTRALSAAQRRGWTADDCADLDAQLRHRCPVHSREHTAGVQLRWWDLRRAARTQQPTQQPVW